VSRARIGIILVATLGLAQSQTNTGKPRPEFEVAAVRFHSSLPGPGGIRLLSGGRFEVVNLPSMTSWRERKAFSRPIECG
jgi:hypothetical protein